MEIEISLLRVLRLVSTTSSLPVLNYCRILLVLLQ
jgi:hypothetical protein